MRFLIVDDHPLYREALGGTVLHAYPDTNVEEVGSIAGACELLHDARDVDLVMLDLSMCDVSGFDGLMTLRKRFPSLPILVVSGLDEPRIVAEVMRYGAAGFVPKSSDKAALTSAIAAVLRGELAFPRSARHAATKPENDGNVAARIAQLTPQQLRVLVMIRQGKLNKQIAHELSVGDSTVKAHVSEILRKLGVLSRTQIVIETASLNFGRSSRDLT